MTERELMRGGQDTLQTIADIAELRCNGTDRQLDSVQSAARAYVEWQQVEARVEIAVPRPAYNACQTFDLCPARLLLAHLMRTRQFPVRDSWQFSGIIRYLRSALQELATRMVVKQLGRANVAQQHLDLLLPRHLLHLRQARPRSCGLS